MKRERFGEREMLREGDVERGRCQEGDVERGRCQEGDVRREMSGGRCWESEMFGVGMFIG